MYGIEKNLKALLIILLKSTAQVVTTYATDFHVHRQMLDFHFMFNIMTGMIHYSITSSALEDI